MQWDTAIPVSSEDKIDSHTVDAAQEDQLHGNHDWLNSIMADEYKLLDTKGQSKPQIQVVRGMHEVEKNKKCIIPRVVSLGPCHHHREELQYMEEQKKIATRQFVLSCRVDVHKCYGKVAEVLDKARESYTQEINNRVSPQAFNSMMFIDGCFIAHFIEKCNEGAIELEAVSRLFPHIVRDIFLFENQLPFVVLHALMSLRFGSSSTAKEQIFKFITRQNTLTSFDYSNGFPKSLLSGDDEALHLLDILRRMLLGSPVYWEEKTDQKQGCCHWESDDMPNYTPYQFGSVTELKEYGIRFGISHSGHLTSVKFESSIFFPKILLPPMVINDATISQMFNLIAFEMFFESHSNSGVTSFLCFMNSLIRHAADVNELRAKGILHHALGSDEEVAKLFNELPVDPTGDLQVYRNVKRCVLGHCHSRVRVSIARWSRTSFNLMLTAICFVVVVLLILMAVQTVFAAFPRKK